MSLVREYADKIKWDTLFRNVGFCEEFIRELDQRFDFGKDIWMDITRWQRLSEEFIEEYKDKVEWEYVALYQYVTEPFVEKWKEKTIAKYRFVRKGDRV